MTMWTQICLTNLWSTKQWNHWVGSHLEEDRINFLESISAQNINVYSAQSK